MKIVSIHQPAYFPWLGYLHKMMVADQFVILDHVQFEKNSFINRNKIVQPDGTPVWLTVPVLTKGLDKPTINDAKVDPHEPWQKKHLKALRLIYSRCPYWDLSGLDDFYDEVKKKDYSVFLNTVLGAVAGYLALYWGLHDVDYHVSTEYDPPLTKTKSELVLEICQLENADVYFSGAMGKGYLDELAFKKAGIKIVYQDYAHPYYKQYQLRDPDRDFVPNMSVLDLVLNHGPESKDIIMKGNVTKEDVCRQ